MAAHAADSSFRFPDRVVGTDHPSARSHQPESLYGAADHGAGAFRGLAFALIFELALGIVGFSGWQLWRLLH